MSRFLEDEDFIDHEREEEIAEVAEEEEEGYLEEEETLEELDVDDRGHVRRPGRRRRDEEIDPEEY
jgi:hypothetical protein